ncbi:hypothetical protein OCOL_000792 [Ordospora colligata]
MDGDMYKKVTQNKIDPDDYKKAKDMALESFIITQFNSELKVVQDAANIRSRIYSTMNIIADNGCDAARIEAALKNFPKRDDSLS